MTGTLTAVGEALSTFFVYALAAVFTQNAVFSRALGVSRLVKLVNDETTDSFIFCVLLCLVQLFSAPLAYFSNLWLSQQSARSFLRPLVLVLCTGVAFTLVLVGAVTLLRPVRAKQVVAVLPMASFNCAILGTLLIATTQSFNLLQTIGFGLGSAVGYLVAVFVVTEGERRIRHDRLPKAMQGLPIMLLYIGILALAIYGFTGHMLAY